MKFSIEMFQLFFDPYPIHYGHGDNNIHIRIVFMQPKPLFNYNWVFLIKLEIKIERSRIPKLSCGMENNFGKKVRIENFMQRFLSVLHVWRNEQCERNMMLKRCQFLINTREINTFAVMRIVIRFEYFRSFLKWIPFEQNIETLKHSFHSLIPIVVASSEVLIAGFSTNEFGFWY